MEHSPKIIGVINEKGGVGKTFNTYALSTFLSHYKGKRVLVIDMDSSMSLTNVMEQIAANNGFKSDDSEYELCTTESLFQKGANPAPNQAAENLFYIGNPPNNRLVSVSDDDEDYFYDAVENLAEQFDFVFLDSQPTLNTLLRHVLSISDGILIPATADMTSLNCTRRIVEKVVRRYGERRGLRASILGILPYYDGVAKNTNLSRSFIELYQREFGGLMMESSVHRYSYYAEAYNVGVVIEPNKQNQQKFDMYMAVVDELLSRVADLDGIKQLNLRMKHYYEQATDML